MRRQKRQEIRDHSTYDKARAREQARYDALVADVARNIEGAIKKKFHYHLEGYETNVLVYLSEAGVLGKQHNKGTEGYRLELLKRGLDYAAVHLIHYAVSDDKTVLLWADKPVCLPAQDQVSEPDDDLQIHWILRACMGLSPSSAWILREEFPHH